MPLAGPAAACALSGGRTPYPLEADPPYGHRVPRASTLEMCLQMDTDAVRVPSGGRAPYGRGIFGGCKSFVIVALIPCSLHTAFFYIECSY